MLIGLLNVEFEITAADLCFREYFLSNLFREIFAHNSITSLFDEQLHF